MKRSKTIGKVLPAPNKTRPSDVLAIPLGLGYFGYARVLKGCFLEILDLVTVGNIGLNGVRERPRRFYIEFYEPYGESPWIYLGKSQFKDEQESWGPPVWFGVPFQYIVEKGVTRKVPMEETRGVMKQQLVHPDGIVDRIIEEFKLDIPEKQRERLK